MRNDKLSLLFLVPPENKIGLCAVLAGFMYWTATEHDVSGGRLAFEPTVRWCCGGGERHYKTCVRANAPFCP